MKNKNKDNLLRVKRLTNDRCYKEGR